MDAIRERFPKPPGRAATLQRFIQNKCHELREMGVFNMLLTDSRHLYCYCTTKLSWITRKAPFDQACLKDAELTVDFDQVTSQNDIVTVIATEPLTSNEQWSTMKTGEMIVFHHGCVAYHA